MQVERQPLKLMRISIEMRIQQQLVNGAVINLTGIIIDISVYRVEGNLSPLFL